LVFVGLVAGGDGTIFFRAVVRTFKRSVIRELIIGSTIGRVAEFVEMEVELTAPITSSAACRNKLGRMDLRFVTEGLVTER
jgi:hypothetical protein